MCENIDVVRMEEVIGEEGDEIGKIHEEICLLE